MIELIYDFRNDGPCMESFNLLRAVEGPLQAHYAAQGLTLFSWAVRAACPYPKMQTWLKEARAFLAGKGVVGSAYEVLVATDQATLAAYGEQGDFDPLFVLSRKYPLELADYIVDHPDPHGDRLMVRFNSDDYYAQTTPLMAEVLKVFTPIWNRIVLQICGHVFGRHIEDSNHFADVIRLWNGLNTADPLYLHHTHNALHSLWDNHDPIQVCAYHNWIEPLHGYFIQLGESIRALGYRTSNVPAVWRDTETGEVW